MDGEQQPIYFEEVAQFVKTNYVALTSIFAAGFGLVLLRRYCSGGKCYSNAKLAGKVVIVTGANTGIGKETAKDLARRGAKVILACRNLSKAEKAAEEIRKETGSMIVVVKELDLASLESVRSFAKSIIEDEPHLDILINNAGVYMTDRHETVDGFEMTWHTNHLGPFLLTNLLLDLLKNSAPSRIVSVSSILYVYGEINFDDPDAKSKYGDKYAYNQSKLATVMFTNELARRLQGTGVTSYSVHPGVVATEVFRDIPIIFQPLLYVALFLIAKSPKDGAQTTIHCAVDESLENESGYFYSDCKRKNQAPQALDEEVARRLWKMSADMVDNKQN